MNTADFITSLSTEQLAALTSVRDELLAANSEQNAELVAAKADEISGLQKQLADKDASHEATIARLSEEHKAALDSLTISSGTTLEALRVQLLEKHEAEMQAALDELAKVKAEADADDSMSKILIAGLTKERDAALAQFAAIEARRDNLAKASVALAANLRTVTEQVEALSAEASKDYAAKQAEEVARQLAEAEALVAKLKGNA